MGMLTKILYEIAPKIFWSFYYLVLIHKDIFACLFSIHNIISLSCHEQVCLSGLPRDTSPIIGQGK